MIDFENIDLSCDQTWQLIGEGNTKGVFQLESRLGQSMAKKLKPSNIEELAALISIMRPGCISGDTKVFINQYKHSFDGKMRFKKCKIRDIADNKDKFKTLLSYNEQTGKFVNNQMTNVFYTGHKECFQVVVRSNERKKSDYGAKEYKLQCTADHKLLTLDGWKELKDIQINERILLVKRRGTRKPGIGTTSYRQRCYNNYVEKCIFCDWNKGSLDVNHISENRFTNNHHDNLCYMCPNHHREFTEGNICIEQISDNKEKHKLPKTTDGKWGKLADKISVGIKDVYDISMMSPHHNFIAGGIIVHNCLEAVRDGKTVSNHYIDKKNLKESVDYFHPSLESILSETFGEMVYQEQAMQICQRIAAFNLSEADMLRKAIGKKNPQEMAKIKTLFVQKTKEEDIVNQDEAEKIFGWIEKSQRYSFNKSHAISYAFNAYVSAYAKTHHPLQFYTSYLRFAKDKIDPMKEIYELVNNAIETGIKICRPDFRKLNKDFELVNHIIYFGLTNIKGVGDSVFNKIIEIVHKDNIDINSVELHEVLFLILDRINSTAAKNLISVGGLDYLKVSRKKILFYLDIISNLSNREKEIILSNIDINQKLEKILYDLLPSVNKKRKQVILSLINAINSPAYNLDDNYEWIANTEKQLLGISITCSIIDGRDTDAANCDCQRLNKDKNLPKNIIIAAEVAMINMIKTKKGKNPGQDMAFLKITDGTGSCDIVVFPKEFENMKNILYEGNTIMLSLEQSKDKDSVFAKRCWQI